jgi:hypothetical protein
MSKTSKKATRQKSKAMHKGSHVKKGKNQVQLEKKVKPKR